MQNNIPTVHISKIHCYTIKSNILKIKLSCCHGNTDVNAFSVDQLLILLVKSMLGKYSQARGCYMHIFLVTFCQRTHATAAHFSFSIVAMDGIHLGKRATLLYYLKNEQECFIRFKATSAQREWL
jgi:hypothetical protein